MTQDPATYINPWYNPEEPEYKRIGPRLYTVRSTPKIYRGCLIYRISKEWFDVVKDGVCLTQRAGPNGARQAIDKMLDDPTDWFSEKMIEYHIKYSTACKATATD